MSEEHCVDWQEDCLFVPELFQVRCPARTRHAGIDFNVKVISPEKHQVYIHHSITR